MNFEPWMLGAMEEQGITDTPQGHINRVANYLKENGSSSIGNDEFAAVCRECDVDPSSFDSGDLSEIEKKMNR